MSTDVASASQIGPDNPSEINNKYLLASKAGCLHVIRQRLASFIKKEHVILVRTPNWRTWWKTFNDRQRGTAFTPPFILIRFQDIALVDHQNTVTMLKSGLMHKKNDHQVNETILFNVKVSGQMQILHRDSEAQTALATTILVYLKGGAFNFDIQFPTLPKSSTCTVDTEDRSIQVPDGLAIAQDSEQGDISTIDMSFYGLFWVGIDRLVPRAKTINITTLNYSEFGTGPILLNEFERPVRPSGNSSSDDA